MKSLKSFLEELYATPADTMGMGNPMAPTDNHPGTEPIAPICKKKKRKKV